MQNGVPLPPSWAAAAIGEITLPIEQMDPKQNPEAEFAYLDISSIDNSANVVTESKQFVGAEAPSRARQKVMAGDVLFSTVRPYLKNIARVTRKYDGALASTGFSVLRAAGEIDPDYLFYYTLTPGFLQSLTPLQRGSSYPAVRDQDVRGLHVPIPPAGEQRRIVAKIEELFSELDQGVESLKLAREQLRVYRQTLLKHAFEEKLTAAWRGERGIKPWRKTSLGQLFSLITSGSRGWAKYYAEAGDAFIRAQNLKHNRLDFDDIAYVALPDTSEGMRTRIQVGDLLVTITGANVTRTGLVTSDPGIAYVSQHVALCRPVEGVLPEFLYWFLIADAAGRRQLNEFAYGAGKPGLNLDNIRSVTLLLPDLDEQLEIVRRLNSALFSEEELRATIDLELTRCTALRQSILKRAFSGQIVPQDPSDEPASVLLERIRAERAGSTNGKSRHTVRSPGLRPTPR